MMHACYIKYIIKITSHVFSAPVTLRGNAGKGGRNFFIFLCFSPLNFRQLAIILFISLHAYGSHDDIFLT